MPQHTITQALHAMRRLSYADAGRLAGVDPFDSCRVPAAKTGAPGWPPQLNAALAARTAGTVTADTPAYLVLSDGYPICWLTVDAVVVTPDASLSRNQANHRQQVSAALSDLSGPALTRLADARDLRDGRPDDVDDIDHRPARIGSLRVAHPRLPARSWWVPITGDLDESRRRLAEVTGTTQPVIITGYGFGGYGRDPRRPRLDVLCTLQRTGDAHVLPASVVGDWLVAEGGHTAATLDADTIPAAFAEAYRGRFDNEPAYARYRLAELGWQTTLLELGALEFFDLRAFERHLFAREVRAWRDYTTRAGIVVCRRRPR